MPDALRAMPFNIETLYPLPSHPSHPLREALLSALYLLDDISGGC
jgi:hypothetical protein